MEWILPSGRMAVYLDKRSMEIFLVFFFFDLVWDLLGFWGSIMLFLPI